MTMLLFPDLDTLRLVLSSDLVPPAVAVAPVKANFEHPEGVLVHPSVKLAKPALVQLKKLGVEPRNDRPARSKRSPAGRN